MKVKVVDVEEAALVFLKKIISTLPDTGYRFLAGAKLATAIPDIEGLLTSFADADGCVDTDVIRSAVKAGTEASGDRISFTVGSPKLAMLLKPVTVTVTPHDLEEAISSVERMYR